MSPESYPSHILFSLMRGKVSLYLVALCGAMTTNDFSCSMSVVMYSRISENGGFVTTMSASSRSAIHSALRKSPSPSSISMVFSPVRNSSATSSMSMPPSPVVSWTEVTMAL